MNLTKSSTRTLCLTGTIEKVSRWSDTHVWSSGGGGYVDPKYGGHVQAAQVHSDVTQRCEVLIKSDDRSVISVDIGFSGIGCHEGNQILLLSGSLRKGEKSYAFIKNLSTGSYWSKQLKVNIHGHFVEWFFRCLLAFALFWPICYFAWGVFNPIQSASTVKTEEVLKYYSLKCPFGGSIKPRNTICEYGTPQYSTGRIFNPVIACKCPTELQIQEKIKIQAENRIRNAKQRLDQDMVVSGWLIGGLLSIIFGSILTIRDTSKRRKVALSERDEYLEELIACAKGCGIKLGVEKQDGLMLRPVDADANLN